MEGTMVTLPINVLSYSSLMQLLGNPLIFKYKHILNVYDSKMSVSGMIGRAGHEALKTYYGGNMDVPMMGDRGLAIDTGLKYLETFGDAGIDYGKTGSREKMLKGYAQAMNFYFAEEPKYHKVLMCEEKMTAELRTSDGEILPLPATGSCDLVHQRKDGKIEIIDTKFVVNFTDWETEDYNKIIQSQFYKHLLIASKGLKPYRMLFREIKRTANMDGKPQIRDWAIPFDHKQYEVFFYNLYRDVVKYLSNNPIFLPNLRDPFDGEQAGLIYSQGLINSDMSDVEVMHKVKDVAYTSKKFVSSRLDREDNKHLLPDERVKLRLAEFGIPVEPVETKVGPSVTQYRFKVSAGVRMETIKKLKDDIALAMAVKGEIRIIAPIPGTSLIGVEVENEKRTSTKLTAAHLRPGTLSLPIGIDVHGAAQLVALDQMPHLLIAGTTGSGKSILLHTIINALTQQLKPAQLELVLIDPKRVELRSFARRPHVKRKVVYEYQDAVKVLTGLTEEMERRYKLLSDSDRRDLAEYNASRRDPKKRLPYIVTIIDEFADLMMRKRKRLTKKELEEEIQYEDAQTLIVRLAQMARAVGIHLIIATQRPSVDVMTGLIKANFPTRIALTTASPTDSKIIIGKEGAEKLAGKGDMIFMYPGNRGEVRLQGFLN